MITNWKKNVTIFMISQGLTLLGSMLAYYAIFWHITLTTQSGMMMLLFTLVQALPMFFMSPFGGVWADRYNKKHLINIADGVIAITTLFMAIMFSLGFEYIALLLVCGAVRSFGQGVQTPAVGAIIPEIVPEEKLIKVNGLNSSIQYFIMFLSPIIAGGLLALVGLEVLLFIDVITAAIGITLLYFFVQTKKTEKKKEEEHYFKELVEGIKYAAKNTFIKKFLVVSAIFNIMICPMAILSPLHVTRAFGPEVWRLSVLEAFFFIGAMLGGLLIGTWGGFKNKVHTLALASVLSGLGGFLLGFSTNFFIFIIIMGLIGIFMGMFNPPLTSILQVRVDKAFMGRIFSLLAMVSSLIMPLAMVLWGPLSDKVKLDYIFIFTGVAIALTGLFFLYDKTMLKAGDFSDLEEVKE